MFLTLHARWYAVQLCSPQSWVALTLGICIAEHVANGIDGSLHNDSAAELADDAESSWASGSIIVGGSGSTGDLAGAPSHRHVVGGAYTVPCIFPWGLTRTCLTKLNGTLQS